MTLDIRVMQEIAEKSYVRAAVDAFSDPGARSLRALLEFLPVLYTRIEPEGLDGPLVVFQALDDATRPVAAEPTGRYATLELLGLHVRGRCVIQPLASGEYLVWSGTEVDGGAVSGAAIVYRYEARQEWVFIRGTPYRVLNPLRVHASIFAVPTFRELREAIEYYAVRMARTSTCQILSRAWYDEGRLFLKSGPEADMRDSLTQFLRITLRNAEVRPEQNVDTTHPIDIKVIWELTNRLALIEIKWLGKSLDEKGGQTANYSEGRARQGAKQLAEYLDANRTGAPGKQSRGYLVVFDARRWRIKPGATTVSIPDGMRYRDSEIRYAPEYHQVRDDFEAPVRMFVEPTCSQN
jgi:hypothetical protein